MDSSSTSSSTATRCLSCEELDAIAGGAAVSPSVVAHLARCRTCAEVVEAARFARRFGNVLAGKTSAGGFTTEELAEYEARYPDALGYRFIAEVARGGQGVVYRAEQTATGQIVAIKALHAGRSGTGGLSASMARARFVREIQIAASLQHGGLVRVLDSIILGDGRDAIIMEWIDGTPMDEWADARRSTDATSERELLRLVADAADAVAYAHQRGVIHRDLKPSNVLVDAWDRAHVLDFGVAWRREDADKLDTERLTLAGEFTGTLAFAAPEQVSGEGHMPDTRTDVYALGVIAFRVLTGSLPYDVDRSLETAIRNITHAEAPANTAGTMSHDAWMVVCKAMSKDPARRYQTASEFAADLRRVADGLAISARADSRLYVLRKAAKRHRVAIGFGLTVLVGLSGMLTSLSIGNARLSAALRESRMQQLRTHTAVGARDRAEDILWEEVASSVPSNIDARRALWEGSMRQRELLWSFVELQAQATCVDVLDFSRRFPRGGSGGGGVRSIDRLHDGRFGLVTGDQRAAWLNIAFDRAEVAPGVSLPSLTGRGRFAPGGRYLMTHDRDMVRCIDTTTGQVHASLDWATLGFEVAAEQTGDWGAVLCSRSDSFVVVGLPALEQLACVVGVQVEHRPWIHPHQQQAIFIDEHGDVVNLDVSTGKRTRVARAIDMGWSDVPRHAQVLSTLDGRTIAVAHIDGITIASLNGTGGVDRLRQIKPGSRVTASLSGDGRFITAQTFGDAKLRLWDCETGQELPGLPGHRGAVLVHAISHDASRIVTADQEGFLRIWRGPGHGWRTALSKPTSRTHQFVIAESGNDNSAEVTALDAKGRLVQLPLVPRGDFADTYAVVSMSRRGLGTTTDLVRADSVGVVGSERMLIAAAGVSDRIVFVTRKTMENNTSGSKTDQHPVTTESWVSVGRDDTVTGLAFMPQRKSGAQRLLVCTQRGDWIVFDRTSDDGTFVESARARLDPPAPASDVCRTPDGSLVAVSFRDGRVAFIDTATLAVVRVVRASASQVRSVAFSPDGFTLAAVGDSGELILIDTNTGAVRRSGQAVEDSMFAVAFHPSGRTVAVGDRVGRVMMFDVAGPSLLGTLRAGGAVMYLGFTPDGGSLVVSSLDSPIERWDFDLLASTFPALRTGR